MEEKVNKELIPEEKFEKKGFKSFFQGGLNKLSSIKDKIIVFNENRKIEQESKKKEDDLRKLMPIFKKDLSDDFLSTERVIRFVNYDSRLDNELYKDSIGFYTISKDRRLLNIYSRYKNLFPIEFYPSFSEGVFVVDPIFPNKYIEINAYYDYMKEMRVNELTSIAQCLGAKSVSIKLVEKKERKEHTFFGLKVGAKVAYAKGAPAVGTNDSSEKREENYKTLEVWTETRFNKDEENHIPTTPSIMYFKNESDIKTLIDMVLSNKSKLISRTYTMKASTSLGFTLNEAMSVDACIKMINANVGCSYLKDIKEMSESFLQYTINFE